MRNRRDAQPLLSRDRAHQRARRDKENVLVLASQHIGDNRRAQHRRCTAAARAARMDILRVAVENHETAVVVKALKVVALALHKLVKTTRTYKPEVAREHEVVVRRLRPGVLKKVAYGLRRGRC